MRMLERNEKIIYYSKRHLTEDGIEYFDTPVALRCNPMPVSVEWARVESGAYEKSMKKFLIARDTLQNAIIFSLLQGDRFYVDAVTPATHDEELTAEGADYVVVGVEDTPNYIGVILKRLAV